MSVLKEFSNWETITIEENDELDQPITSTIRVPAQPSISLQSFLHRVCRQLGQSVTHTLAPSVTRMLAEELSTRLQRTYQTFAESEFVNGNQNASLQCYLDVKFVALLMVPRDQKQSSELWYGLAEHFKANVDPFDFELFHKYIAANVKKSAQRMHVSF